MGAACPFRAGWTRGISVVIPNTNPQRPFTNRVLTPPDLPVIWNKVPPLGYQTHFLVLLVDRNEPQDYQAILEPDDVVLGTLKTANGNRVLLVRREIKVEDTLVDRNEAYVRELQVRYTGDPDEMEASAFVPKSTPDGAAYVLELPLSWDNMLWEGPNDPEQVRRLGQEHGTEGRVARGEVWKGIV